MKKWMALIVLGISLRMAFGGAYFTTGEEFTTNESVTAQKLEDIVEKAEMKTGYGIIATGASSPGTGFLHIDSDDSYKLKYYNNSSWQTVEAIGAYAPTLSTLLENYIDGCWVYRSDADTIGVTAGVVNINGNIRRNTTATTSTYTAPDADDYLDVWALADASANTFTLSIVDSETTPGDSANPGTNGRMLGSIRYEDGTDKITMTWNFRKDEIVFWYWINGNNNQTTTAAGVPFGKTFIHNPLISLTSLASLTGDTPVDVSSFVNLTPVVQIPIIQDITTSNCLLGVTTDTGNTTGLGNSHGILIVAKGRYS